MTTFKTYKAAAGKLENNGFTLQEGMPLSGVRYKSENQLAFVLRMGDNNYQISFYDIIATA